MIIAKGTVAQKCHGNFNFTHGNFNLFTAISICSRQFQLVHGNFNLLTAISTCSRQFQFAHGNFNLLTAISIYPRQFQFYSRQFQFYLRQRSQHFPLRSPPVSYSRRQWPCTKSQNAKSKVDISSRSSKKTVKNTNQKSIYELA